MHDKQVVLYPTYGYQQGDEWVIPVRAWVKEDSNKIRQLASVPCMATMDQQFSADTAFH